MATKQTALRGWRGDEDKAVTATRYDRKESKKMTMMEIEEQLLGESIDEAHNRFAALGVDRNSLINQFGSKVYYYEFEDLDEDERYAKLLEMLGK